MKNQSVLIVDDEPDIRELVEMTLARMNVKSVSAENIASAKKLLEQENYFLCLTDMCLPDGDGVELVEYIQQNYPSIPVAVITAFGNVENAVTTLKSGAFDYVSKPVDLNILRNLVNTALTLDLQVESTSHDDSLIGTTELMVQLRAKINKLSRSQAPVFISGESGTGKELVAQMIHQQGPRVDKPFVPVNCGAIPAELMESEFFGHKKGSFTGAYNDKVGLFQAAEGGTLFLDEVADLPLHMQVKLLRAIQEKAVRPVGGANEVSIDTRVLSASHKDLAKLVETGEFRQDLFYRINVIELQVPSLKQRPADVPLLVDHILYQLAKSRECAKSTISNSSMNALKLYNFPGNVRELENILERAMTLCDNNAIETADLQLPEFIAQAQSTTEDEDVALDDYLDDREKELIVNALERHKWNRTQAAKDLGISFRALRYRLKKLGLD